MPDLFDLEGDAAKDLGRHRTLALENGNLIHFKCSDPFGFWTVNFDKGQMPETLTGQYTSFEEAEKSVRVYLNQKNKQAAEETELVVKEDKKLKKVG